MQTQNEPEQMELPLIHPVCKAHGCMQQKHFETIRKLQGIIAKLEEELDAFDNQE